MKYCVINERGKFGAKIFLHYTDIVISYWWYCNMNHPVYDQQSSAYYGHRT